MGNEPALSFGTAAELYDRIRPTYPAEALRWALDGAGRRIVDLGAGTGIMTRVLVNLGYEVTAVEPDSLMRARLLAASPGITALGGAAESIPLPDGSVDGVVAAQSYHWFDPQRALTEIGRVIRPGGTFAAIWNDRDESVPWVAEYAEIIEGADRPAGRRHVSRRRSDPDSIQFGPLFTTVEHASFAHEAKQTAAGLLDLMHSRSRYLTASPHLRGQLDDQVRALVADHPDLREREEFPLPYVTTAFRATRR
ncbi:class I SAM-dependent methyltransferase [Luedemannella helvata]